MILQNEDMGITTRWNNRRQSIIQRRYSLFDISTLSIRATNFWNLVLYNITECYSFTDFSELIFELEIMAKINSIMSSLYSVFFFFINSIHINMSKQKQPMFCNVTYFSIVTMFSKSFVCISLSLSLLCSFVF